MGKKAPDVQEAGEVLVRDNLEAVVQTLEEVDLDWTTGSPFFDLARQMLIQMEDQVPSDLLKNNRPDILQGMTDALEASEKFEVETRDTEDEEDPTVYRRVVLK